MVYCKVGLCMIMSDKRVGHNAILCALAKHVIRVDSRLKLVYSCDMHVICVLRLVRCFIFDDRFLRIVNHEAIDVAAGRNPVSACIIDICTRGFVTGEIPAWVLGPLRFRIACWIV